MSWTHLPLGPLFFHDEPDRIEALDALLPTADIVVPANWSLEVASMILMAERRKRIDSAYRARLFVIAASLNAAPDGDSFGTALGAVVALALRHGLTVYDAAYLELAKRRSLPLATLDIDLVDAGRAAGVEILTAQ